jgi:hypothetical protein
LKNLPRVSSSNLSLDILSLTGHHGRESAVRHVLLHQGVLEGPLLSQPEIKDLLIVQRDVGDSEATPIKVDRLGRAALEVSAGEAEIILAILSSTV